MPDFCPASSARFPFAQRDQNRRSAEIEIGTIHIGTVGPVGQAAGGCIGIVRGHLAHPKNFPVFISSAMNESLVSVPGSL